MKRSIHCTALAIMAVAGGPAIAQPSSGPVIDDATASVLSSCQIGNGLFVLRRGLDGTAHAEVSPSLTADQLQCSVQIIASMGLKNPPELPPLPPR